MLDGADAQESSSSSDEVSLTKKAKIYLQSLFIDRECAARTFDGGRSADEFLGKFWDETRIESLFLSVCAFIVLAMTSMLGGVPPPTSWWGGGCWRSWLLCMVVQLSSNLLSLVFLFMSFASFRWHYAHCLVQVLGSYQKVGQSCQVAK